MRTALHIRGSVQIIGTGIFAIGTVHAVSYLCPPEVLLAISPHGVLMALATAVLFMMTGAGLFLLSWKPKVKTEYFYPPSE